MKSNFIAISLFEFHIGRKWEMDRAKFNNREVICRPKADLGQYQGVISHYFACLIAGIGLKNQSKSVSK